MSAGEIYVSFGGGEDPNILEVVVEESEGHAATVTVVCEQTGLQDYLEGKRQIIVVKYGSTEVARAYIMSPPSGLLTSTQVWTGTCAPMDLDSQLLNYAKANFGATVAVDKLFSDFDEEDPQSYLLNRTGFYHVDPMTHEIDIIDELRGDRVVDLSDVALMDEGRVREVSQNEFGPLVHTLKARCVVEWTQSLTGSIAGHTFSFDTLDPGIAKNPMEAIVVPQSEGWTMGKDYSIRVTASYTTFFKPNTEYKVDVTNTAGHSYTMSVQPFIRLKKYDVVFPRIPFVYDFTQDRKETVEATLQIPLAVAVVRQTDDVVEIGLGDMFASVPDGPDEWVAGASYAAGDVVTYGGHRYVALKANSASSIHDVSEEKRTTTYGNETYQTFKPFWELAPIDTSELGPYSHSVFTTRIGKAVGETIMRRLGREARRRLRALRVSVRLTWADAADLTMKDSVKIRAFDGSRFYTLVGKICRIRRSWSSDAPPIVEVEVGIAFGDGRESPTPDPGNSGPGYSGGYAEPGFDEALAYLSRHHGRLTQSVEHHFTGISEDPTQKLRNGNLIKYSYEGTAVKQFNAARSIAAEGGDLRECTSTDPTRIVMRIKPIASGGVIEALYRPQAILLDSPCGIER